VGETKEDALANIEDAKRAWIEAAMEDGLSIPEPLSLDDYSGQFKLRIPKSLHRSLAEHAREEGTSMNQYCLYLLSKNDTAEGVNGL
jgi:predicted HicB family RNase H-like nuclease